MIQVCRFQLQSASRVFNDPGTAEQQKPHTSIDTIRADRSQQQLISKGYSAEEHETVILLATRTKAIKLYLEVPKHLILNDGSVMNNAEGASKSAGDGQIDNHHTLPQTEARPCRSLLIIRRLQYANCAISTNDHQFPSESADRGAVFTDSNHFMQL
ncbi:MAG: hypothetical protein AB2729_01780 [Candidatus Thiodiazotropha taylori]